MGGFDGSKTEKIVDLLKRPGGVTLKELMKVTGWQPHSVEFSSIIHPPLTTIHQPKYEMGHAAVEILLRLARVIRTNRFPNTVCWESNSSSVNPAGRLQRRLRE